MSRSKTKTKAQPKRSFLPLVLGLLGVGLVMLAIFAFANNNRGANPQAGSAPRLQVDQESIDHGDVKLGVTQRSVVQVTNAGDQPLRFTEAPYIEVKAGC